MAFIIPKLDTSEARADLAHLAGPQARAAVKRSIKRAVKSGSRYTAKLIGETYNVRLERVKKAISTRSEPDGSSIFIAGRASSLTDFRGTTQTRRGVGVRVKKKGGRKVIRGAFLARMDSGHRGAFQRKGEPRRRSADGADLPITELRGPAVQQALTDRKQLLIVAHVANRYETELARDVAFRTFRSASE